MKLLLKLALMVLTFVAPTSCSGSSSGEEPKLSTSVKFVSSDPANNATGVSTNLDAVTVTFDGAVKVANRQLITFDGKSVAQAIATDKTVRVTVSGLKKNGTYELLMAKGSLTDTKGNVLNEVKVTFKTQESKEPTEGLSAEAVAKNMVLGWNLGNALESSSEGVAEEDQETSWGNPATTKAMIDAVKAAGFNAVRIPVMWYRHCDEVNGELKVRDRWMKRVKEVVGYVLDNGMYAIINTHHETWLQEHPYYAEQTVVRKKAESLWKQIAEAFADYDDHLLIAGTNEVHITDQWGAPTKETQDVQNQYNQWFVDVVRATGGKNAYRNLIVQTYCTSPESGLAGMVIPTDVCEGRLMIEVHYYQPSDFALEGKVYYWGEPYKALGVSEWGQESQVDDLFKKMKAAWVDKGYPVIMGECGVTNHFTEADKDRQAESRKYYAKYIVSKAKENGIVPFVWDNGAFGNGGENFGLFDRKNNMKVTATKVLEGLVEGSKTKYPW